MDHWDPVIERFCFIKYSEHINPVVGERARAMAQFVRLDLAIEALPKIVWISPCLPSLAAVELGGSAQDEKLEMRNPRFSRLKRNLQGGFTPINGDQQEIWIRRDLEGLPNVEFVVAHELRHAWQKVNAPEIFKVCLKAEADAYLYGYDAAKRYLLAHGKLNQAQCAEIDNLRERARTEFN